MSDNDDRQSDWVQQQSPSGWFLTHRDSDSRNCREQLTMKEASEVIGRSGIGDAPVVVIWNYSEIENREVIYVFEYIGQQSGSAANG